MSHQKTVLTLVLVFTGLLRAERVPGQENGVDANVAGDTTAAKADEAIREQTIYIPYEKLQKTFEKEGRGIFLPYEKFQELWKAARQQTRGTEPPERPVDALISAIESDATIGEQVVNVKAALQLEILGKGWFKIPLRLRESAIRTATLNGQPARLVFDPMTGHHLLYENTGEEPVQAELQLEYTRAFTKTPGQSSVTFQAPQAPINRWRVRVPEAGMAVQIEPMIAATRTPADGVPEDAQRTDLLAFVGAAATVRIAWNPKAEGASGLAAFTTVQVEQQIVVSEGVARTSVKLDYDISRATLTQLEVDVPEDQKVVNVFDRNVKRWNVLAEEGKQVVRVELFEPTLGKQTLLVELEKFRDATQEAYEVSAAVVRAVGVGRQQGIVVARLEEGLQGEAVQRGGLLQLDQDDLPAGLRNSRWAFAYRYGAVPYQLVLRVEKVLPRISVTELAEAELTTDRLTLDWQGLYQIEDAGLFQLRLEIPAEFEVRSIAGKAVSDSQPASVDSYHRVANDSTTWMVNLSKKALGPIGLSIQLQRMLSDPNLLAPTGSASTIEIPLPRAHADEVEFAQGSLILNAPQSLLVNPAVVEGLRSISFDEAYQKIPAVRQPTQTQPVLAYSFAKGSTTFSVTAERRRPQVTVNQLLQAEIDSGVVKFNAAFFYDIQFSGVKSLRIDVPSSLVTDIRNANKSLRREEIKLQPEDVAEDYTAWSFAAENELLGAVKVNLTWEQKIEELGIGKSQDVLIPRLIPAEVDRATGYIVISKSESIDVQPTEQAEGLEPIDPRNDVRVEAKVDSAAMAFRFVGDWSLQVRATRYKVEASKLTSIERGLVRIVALTQGELSVQALFRMRSARQRLAIHVSEQAVFDAQLLRINGKPVTAERESATTISAPLVDQDIDKTFVLELRYSIPGTPAQIDLPAFPDDPAVQQVYLCTYLSEKKVLLASAGPWCDETTGTGIPLLDPPGRKNDRELIGWVTESNGPAATSANTFPIGRSQLFVYSTLQPQGAPDGSLQLTTMGRQSFNALVVLVIGLLGVPLFRRSLRSQLAMLLMTTAAVLMIGVFFPELSRTVFASIFLPLVVFLVLIWLAGHLSRMKWRRLPNPPATTASSANPFAASEPVAAAADEADPKPVQSNVPANEDPPVEAPPRTEAGDDEPQDRGGRRDV